MVDLSDAIFELKGLVTDHLGHIVFPEEALFASSTSTGCPGTLLRMHSALLQDL